MTSVARMVTTWTMGWGVGVGAGSRVAKKAAQAATCSVFILGGGIRGAAIGAGLLGKEGAGDGGMGAGVRERGARMAFG